MSLEIVRQAVARLRDEYVDTGHSPVEINLGLCADFADELWRSLRQRGLEIDVMSLDDFWSENGETNIKVIARRKDFAPPPGLDWDGMGEIDIANQASHSWIEFDGLCFDAEAAEGVRSPFDLPCIRHALTEIMEREPGRLDSLFSEHGWWRQAMEIRTTREAEALALLGTMPERPSSPMN